MTTIKDVAERANVSKSTVSYAFNKPHLVSAKTLERILDAAKSLNYEPNIFAQGLAGGKAQMIGLLVPDIRYPFNATIARSIEERLRKDGYIVVVTSTGGTPDEIVTLMGQLRRRGVGGFILVPSYFGVSQELVQAIKALTAGKVPTIVAGYELDDPAIDQVTYQPQRGSREAVDYLVSLGHRDIAYIGARHSAGNVIKRYLGYQESLKSHRIPLRPELVIETDVTPAQITEKTDVLLSLPKPPSAIFAFNDVVAFAVLDYCAEHEITIPDSLSLVTFDYQALVQRNTPGITSIVVPVYEVGQVAAELLLERMQNPDGERQQVELPYELVIRETTHIV